jgi:hypothetical protein
MKKNLKYCCQNETLICLKTIERNKITAFVVKPIGKEKWNFKAYYLYGHLPHQLETAFG